MKKILVAVLVLSAGCSLFTKKKTDQEHAAEERAEAKKAIEKSLSLTPYRGLKITLRSAGSAKQPEAVKAFAELSQPGQDPRHLLTALALYRARHALEGLDEDQFPTLWEAFLRQPVPFPAYDASAEHLCVAALWILFDASLKPPAGLSEAILFYELEHVTPSDKWPRGLRALTLVARGISYAQGGWHYAADEELTKYLAEIDAMTPADRALTAAFLGRPEPQVTEGARALGYFVRAWNRLGLKRSDAAADDVEKGLASLEKLGIDNEATQWGWAFVHWRRNRPAKAAEQLVKLAQSPYLDEAGKKEVLACAEELKSEAKDPHLFSHERAALILGRALVARAGGPEKILILVAGEERGKVLAERLAWLDKGRRALGAPSEMGKHAFDFVKDKIKK